MQSNKKQVEKGLVAVVPFSSAGRLFLRRSRQSQPQAEAPTCSSGIAAVLESALDYVSDFSSTLTDKSQSSAASLFVPLTMPWLNQNRRK